MSEAGGPSRFSWILPTQDIASLPAAVCADLPVNHRIAELRAPSLALVFRPQAHPAQTCQNLARPAWLPAPGRCPLVSSAAQPKGPSGDLPLPPVAFTILGTNIRTGDRTTGGFVVWVLLVSRLSSCQPSLASAGTSELWLLLLEAFTQEGHPPSRASLGQRSMASADQLPPSGEVSARCPPWSWRADEMDQTPPVRSEYLVSGIRTPPVRRNSKLATLGRIFKPWKWRKKKNEKLKQTTSVLEKKMAGRQGREELIKKGLLEMMEQDAESKTASPDSPQSAQSEPPAPQQDVPTPEDAQPGSPLAAEADQASVEEPPSSDAHLDDAGSVFAQLCFAFEPAKMQSAPGSEDVDAEHARSLLPTPDELSQALAGSDSLESAPRPLERPWGQLPSPPQLPTPPPKASSKATKSVTGQATFFQGSSMKSPSPPLRGQLSTPTGSPHLTTVHRPLPPSRVIEELHRALATKHRQDSFQGRESKGSPKKRADVRLSRTSSLERGKGKEEAWSSDGATESKRAVAKESEENKENLILNSELQDDLLLYQDEEALNESVISGDTVGAALATVGYFAALLAWTLPGLTDPGASRQHMCPRGGLSWLRTVGPDCAPRVRCDPWTQGQPRASCSPGILYLDMAP
ncbi:Phosphatase and actin regulator 3 [Tupaia chinensis]|uniref:Phosphatase and actin regulator 3 n=1 Tax=Tupaia chinensis TaxID=246437 RepID=L9L938_TUPCH|nr:Phosphatase and actin regulator 3 [Tupaia chinensis]